MATASSRAVFVACLVLLLLSGGCAFRYKFVTGALRSAHRVEERRHLALWGHTRVPPFDLERACPEGVAEFGSYVSFVDWLPGLLTAGLYAPRTVYAVCAEPGGSSP